jgi:antitoxin MazE
MLPARRHTTEVSLRLRAQRWGNSLALRIPKRIAEEARVEAGTLVDLTVTDGKLIAAPLNGQFTLAGLLAGVTKKNLHGEVDFGRPHGHEVW